MIKKAQPRILTGFMELLPEEQIQFNKMYDTIKKVYESFGFLPIDTPVIEYSDVLLAKAGGETEKQIYRFEKGDSDLSLRFDLTVPLARYVSMRYNDLAFPFKRYQMGKVYRGERPQKGRFREFYQCDIDIVGNESLDVFYDAEMPSVIYNVFKKLNIGDFTIRLNNRKILNGFFKNLGLTELSSEVLRIIDKLEKIGGENVYNELIKIGVEEPKINKILDFISIKGSNSYVIEQLQSLSVNDEMYAEGVEELKEVLGYMVDFGIPEKNCAVDLTIARGLDYYTGTVYETILNDYPNLGSICSGGRYDDLTGYYTDKKLPGIGISIGLTRLFSQLREIGLIKNSDKSLVQLLIIPFDKSCLKFALNTAAVFRNAGIITDIYCSGKGLKQKMKFADKSGIPYVALIGENEKENSIVTLKNLRTAEQKMLTPEAAAAEIKRCFQAD